MILLNIKHSVIFNGVWSCVNCLCIEGCVGYYLSESARMGTALS